MCNYYAMNIINRVKYNELAFNVTCFFFLDKLANILEAEHDLKDIVKTISRPSNPPETCFELFLAFRRASTVSICVHDFTTTKRYKNPYAEAGIRQSAATSNARQKAQEEPRGWRSADRRTGEEEVCSCCDSCTLPNIIPWLAFRCVSSDIRSIPSNLLPGASRIARSRFEKLSPLSRRGGRSIWARGARRLHESLLQKEKFPDRTIVEIARTHGDLIFHLCFVQLRTDARGAKYARTPARV